jgi:multicomponent K+:H+ antiporter subunit E
MTRWLPYPMLSACLLVMWLLLNQTLSAGHIALGCISLLIGLVALGLAFVLGRGARRIRRVAAANQSTNARHHHVGSAHPRP